MSAQQKSLKDTILSRINITQNTRRARLPIGPAIIANEGRSGKKPCRQKREEPKTRQGKLSTMARTGNVSTVQASRTRERETEDRAHLDIALSKRRIEKNGTSKLLRFFRFNSDYLHGEANIALDRYTVHHDRICVIFYPILPTIVLISTPNI